ncbi:MAG: serine hydrolase domain-containing protein [Anaerolineales bacterium]
MRVSQPEEVGMSSERLKRINDFMKCYVDGGKAAGFVTLVARGGKLIYLDKYGYQDLATQTPIELDTIFRIYSMTKPITSVGFMKLFERGLVRLEDPVSKFIPAFKDVKVYGEEGKLVDPIREITVHDLLIHTAGLSYGGIQETEIIVDEFYDRAELFSPDIDLEEMVQRIASLPLAYQPGTVWHYSVSMDVLGHLIEIIADMALPDYLNESVLNPLGMKDTSFQVPAEKADRFSTLYGKTDESDLVVIPDEIGGDYFDVSLYLGGSGLVSTIADYYRFAQMVYNRGELDGVRMLSPKTMAYMTANHLPRDLLPISMGEVWPGMGFGLGFSVVLDVPLSGMMGSVGLHGWGGWAKTHFWVDPREKMIGILMMQFIPQGTTPVTNDFRTAVYQAILDMYDS